MLKGTSAWKRPWNMTKLQGAFFPSATTNKLITLRSLNEEDKSRDYSRWEMMGLIFGCWKELLVCREKPHWAAWSLYTLILLKPLSELTKSHMLLVSIRFPSVSERPNFFCPLDTIQGTSVNYRSFVFEICFLQMSRQVILPQIVARGRLGVQREVALYWENAAFVTAFLYLFVACLWSEECHRGAIVGGKLGRDLD